MSQSMTNIKQCSLSITIINLRRKLICRVSTKAQLILYELILQILLFGIMKIAFMLIKSVKIENYLKINKKL